MNDPFARPSPRARAVRQDAPCGDIYEMTAGGAALLGVGGGLLVVSGVLLGVDEVRVGRAKGHQAIVGLTVRF